MNDSTTTDDGLVKAAKVHRARLGRKVDLDVQRNLVSAMNLRNHVHIHAGVEKLELGADERVHANRSNAGLKASGRVRDSVTDLQRGLTEFHGTNLGLLNDTRSAVAH